MPSPGGARKQAGQELHQSGEENYIEIDMNPRLQQQRRSHARENGNSHKLELPHDAAAGRKDQAWAGATDLQYNLQVQVADTSYYLHKFPLMSRSGRLNRLVFESRDTEKDHIMLHDIPGGSEAFEMAARFLYGAKLEITPYNVAILRCAAEYLEMIDSLAGGGGDHGSSSSNLVTKAENYLNSLVMQGSWQDSICVLQSCSSRPELKPWADELEIVRRCSESVAWKACTDPHGIRWSFSSRKSAAAAQEYHHAVAARDWWFSDVSTLSIDVFSKVISAVNLKGMHYTMVASAVVYYAEKWLPGMLLTSEASTMSTTTISRRKAEKQGGSHQGSHHQQQLVSPNFTAELKDESKMKLKNRATLQGIVSIIPPQQDAVSCSFLLQLLRVACMVNAGALCKTDLERRIGMQLDTVSLTDLLIPAYGNDTLYDTDVVQHILDHYLHEQSSATSPPVSPAGSVMSQSSITNGSSLTRASSSKSGSSITTRSGSTASSTTTGTSSSTTTGTSSSGASISGSSSSSTTGTGNSSNASMSGASSNTGRTSMSSSSRDSSNLSSRSSFSSIVSSGSGSSSSTGTTMSSNNLTQSDSAVTSSSSSSSRSSISSMSSEESVKPAAAAEKPGFYISEGPVRKPQYPPTIPNLKVAQLIESYLDEVAKDSNLSVAKFMTLTESFSELPRDSDDCLYRAIDSYLKAHPTLIEQERKKLCRIVDCQQLSLDACMHAASNERLPLRVIVQVLFSEQVKLRNAITGTAVVNELDWSSSSSSGHSPSSTSLSDSSAATSTSGTATTSGSSNSTNSTNSTNTVSATTVGSVSSVVSSLLPGGLSLKESVKLAMLEIETLRKTALEVEALQKAVLEVETLKTGLSSLEILQHNIETITTKFAELAHDYTETTHQVEELTKVVAKHSSKSSGWSSGWKKIAKPFHHKDHHDHHPYKDYSAGLLINKELAEHQKQAAAQLVHQMKISPPIVITPEVPPRQQIERLKETPEIVKEVPAKEVTELLNEQLADTVSNEKETPPFKDTGVSSNQQQKGHPVETANNDHHKGHRHHHREKKHMTILDHGHHKGLHQHQEEDADDVALSSTHSHFKDGDSVSTSSSYKENHHHHNHRDHRRHHHKERSSGNSSHGLNHPHKDHHHHLHSDHHKDQPSSTTSHHSNHKAHMHNHKEVSEHHSSQHHHDHHHYHTDHDSTVSTQSSHREGSHDHAHHHNKKHHNHHQETSEHHHSHHQKDGSDHHHHDHREQQISNRSNHKDHQSKERSSSPIAHSSSHQNKGRSDHHHHHRDQQQNHHHKKHHQHNHKDSDSVSTTSTNSSSQNHYGSRHRHRQYP